MNKLQTERQKIMGISKMDRQERDDFNQRLEHYFKRAEDDFMVTRINNNGYMMPVYCENEIIDVMDVESYLEDLEKRSV